METRRANGSIQGPQLLLLWNKLSQTLASQNNQFLLLTVGGGQEIGGLVGSSWSLSCLQLDADQAAKIRGLA